MHLPEKIRKTLKDQQYLASLECGETDISLIDVTLGRIFLESKPTIPMRILKNAHGTLSQSLPKFILRERPDECAQTTMFAVMVLKIFYRPSRGTR